MKNVNLIENKIKYEDIYNKFKNVGFKMQSLNIDDKNIYCIYKIDNNLKSIYLIYIGKVKNDYLFQEITFDKTTIVCEWNMLICNNIKIDNENNILTNEIINYSTVSDHQTKLNINKLNFYKTADFLLKEIQNNNFIGGLF